MLTHKFQKRLPQEMFAFLLAFAICQLLPQELHGNIICRFMKNEQMNERQIDWLSNEYNNKHLDFCCKECNIYCKVHYYDEYAVKPSY